MPTELKALITEFITHTGVVEWQELTTYVEENLRGTAKNWFYYWIYNAIEITTNDWKTLDFAPGGVFYNRSGRMIAYFIPGPEKYVANIVLSDTQPLQVKPGSWADLERYLSYSTAHAANPFLYKQKNLGADYQPTRHTQKPLPIIG